MVTIDQKSNLSWKNLSTENCYVCKASLIRDPETGSYTILANRLPGCISEGETIEEAVQNIKDAFAGCVASYVQNQATIPWEDVEIEDPVELTIEVVVEVNCGKMKQHNNSFCSAECCREHRQRSR